MHACSTWCFALLLELQLVRCMELPEGSIIPGCKLKPSTYSPFHRCASAAHCMQAAGADVPQALARRMDGALLIVGALNTVLMKKAAFKSQLEPMLTTHVQPCFASAQGHVSMQACLSRACLLSLMCQPPPMAHIPCMQCINSGHWPHLTHAHAHPANKATASVSSSRVAMHLPANLTDAAQQFAAYTACPREVH